MIRNILAALVLCLACALPAFAATPVDVNHADAQTIADSLDGIGISKAQAIVAWRDAHGPFKNVDDLRQVKGFGEKTLERNRDAILLKSSARATRSKIKAEATAESAPRKSTSKHTRKQ